ncbi:MAG: peptidase MA family metallohydrolase [Dehalococcoidia bacterium]
MTRLLLVFAAMLPVALMLFAVPATSARADATIETAAVENGYPKDLTFTLKASAPVAITDVTLRFTILGTGVGALGKPEPGAFTAGTSIETNVKVDTNPNTNWIPAGSEFEWNWELTLADGTVTKGPSSRFLYLPPRKDWKTAENDFAIVYYTGPRDSLAQEMLQAFEEVAEKHGRELLKTEITQKPVRFLLMASNAEIQEAQPSKGTTLDNSDSVVTCGFRPGNSKQLIFGTVSCGGSDPVDTLRHEFAHVLNAAAGEGTLVKLPTWLEEGLAVYAQENPGEYSAVFQSALRRNRTIPFREMSLPVAEEERIILQYGQAYTMTKYLIDTYGVPKLNQLLDSTKKNTRFDVALEQTYGFDLDGFEEEFLAAVGGGAAPTAAPTTNQQPSQPTAVPTARGQDQPQPTSAPTRTSGVTSSDGSDNGLSTTTVLLAGGAVVFLLLGVMSFLLMQILQNQRGGRA